MTSKIIGNALYLELVANPELSEDELNAHLSWQKTGVRQVIILPSAEIDDKLVSPVIMERVVGEYSRKAQWEFTSVGRERLKPLTDKELEELKESAGSDSYFYLPSYDYPEWEALGNSAKKESYAFTLKIKLEGFLQSTRYEWVGESRVDRTAQAWQVREGKPIVVEITEDDLKMATANTTPQAVIRRINKVRGTLDNFPEKLVSFA